MLDGWDATCVCSVKLPLPALVIIPSVWPLDARVTVNTAFGFVPVVLTFNTCVEVDHVALTM
jgi:hypothetical protein